MKLIARGDCFYDITKIKDITNSAAGQALIKAAGSVSNISKSIIPNSDRKVNTFGKKNGGRSATKGQNGVDASNKKRYNGSINNLEKIKASDSTGNKINKIQTVHPNRNALKEMTDDKVLYLSDNKKEPKSCFQSLGTQMLPLGGKRFGLVRSISHSFHKVNTFSKKAADAPRGFTAIGTEASATTRNKKVLTAGRKKL